MTERLFPFSAIVGLKRPRHALMLLAVDHGLKGVLIASPPGTGKTLLARSFPSIVPYSEAGSGNLVGREVAASTAPKERAPSRAGLVTPPPFVDVPVGVTEDMLVGGIDFESTLAEGSRRVSKGLLAKANGGFICVNDIELQYSVNLRTILTVLDSGCVAIERDGISSRHQARFALIGTCDTLDAKTSPALKDRVGLVVERYEAPSERERAEIVRRAQRFNNDPRRFWKDFAVQTAKISLVVLMARSRLSAISISRDDISRLSSTAIDLGIQSSRADLFAVRAARANAALRGGSHVEEADLIAALEYVLLPRAGTGVEQQGAVSEPGARRGVDRSGNKLESQDGHAADEAGQKDHIEDVILQAQDCPVPRELADSGSSSGSSLSRVRARAGRRAEHTGLAHGRYVAAVPAVSGHKQGSRIAIDATLRAAAPHQKTRRAAASNPEGIGIIPGATGFQPAPKIPGGGPPRRATPSRSPKDQSHKGRVIVKPGDLRLKKLKHRSGALFIFLVDTSGSMALGRIGHAKGVMIRLLRQAYLHRDRVALIAFRGTSFEVVLEPTASVELARRAVEAMPAGGGTPLAAGLGGAITLAERARRSMAGEIMLLVFTDGRANVALQPIGPLGRAERDALLRAELADIGRRLRDQGIKPVLVDTGSWEARVGWCASISDALGATYCRLPASEPDELYRQILGNCFEG